jgi:hypothetical protein
VLPEDDELERYLSDEPVDDEVDVELRLGAGSAAR